MHLPTPVRAFLLKRQTSFGADAPDPDGGPDTTWLFVTLGLGLVSWVTTLSSCIFHALTERARQTSFLCSVYITFRTLLPLLAWPVFSSAAPKPPVNVELRSSWPRAPILLESL